MFKHSSNSITSLKSEKRYIKNSPLGGWGVFLLILLFVSCGTKKNIESSGTKSIDNTALRNTEYVRKVYNNATNAKNIVSKIDFTIDAKGKNISVDGRIYMRKDEVIRVVLAPFGIMEVGRVEFTPEYVLVVDRMHKQYVKATYNDLSFLKNNGLNFYSLQALFWNELFKPGQSSVEQKDFANFNTAVEGNETIISFEEGKMNYSWLTNTATGRIKMTNISYRDTFKGNTQLNWEYTEFSKLAEKQFPSNMKITLTTPEKELKLGVRLNYLGNESEWETRTKVSDKYREVDVDQILRRFMAL